MMYKEPWSKKHKSVTGGLPFNLSNSFSEPLTSAELIDYALARGDDDLVAEYHRHSLHYTPNGGSLDLREEVARLYGPEIDADNILIFAGGQAALQTAAYAVLDEGSHSIVFTPGYQSVLQAPEHARSAMTRIKLHADNGWQIDPAEVAQAIRPDTRYIVLNEPYNPAGTIMKADIQQSLVQLARQHDITLLCDEAYRFLEHNEADRLPAMADAYERGISACTMSKPWGACGITIGWLATQDMALKQKCVDVQYFGTACPSRASELQAIMTLRAHEPIVANKLEIIHHNLCLLDDFMTRNNDLFEWVRPSASTVGFVRFKGGLDSEVLGERLAAAGISIKPAYVFSDDVGEYRDYFRIGFGEKVMPEALAALDAFAKEFRESGL